MRNFVVREDLKAYAKVAEYGLGLVSGQVEVTSDCSQRCIACDSWKDHMKGTVRGEMELKTMIKLCKELSSFQSFEHLSLTGGDPQSWDALPAFLDWFRRERKMGYGCNFKLQLNTALVEPLSKADVELWSETVDDVRVSLDAIDKKIYNKIRGDDHDPADVLDRMLRLGAKTSISTNTTVFPENIEEIPDILVELSTVKFTDVIRKAMFLPVIGGRSRGAISFWKRYAEMERNYAGWGGVKTSFGGDSVPMTREYLRSEEVRHVPCAVGKITFHIKPNGDYFPCCLVGGEALPTKNDYIIGNFRDLGLRALVARYKSPRYYEKKLCREICQYKQCAVNVAAYDASGRKLAMP